MDTENLLKLLNAHRVEFVIIGATAGRPKDLEDLKILNTLKRKK
jgi:hypothetical protein